MLAGNQPQVAGHLFATAKTLRRSHRQRERQRRDRSHARMRHQSPCRWPRLGLLGHRTVQFCDRLLQLMEIRAGRIVNKKTRKAIRPRTIDGYSTAVSYLHGIVGDKPLASLDNPEAKELIARMKGAQANGEPRFSDKTICEYFKVFTQVIASAKDDKAKQLYSRSWDLAYICLPMVCQREQHRPTLEPEEVEVILSKCKRFMYRG
jgi:hypothetical protein